MPGDTVAIGLGEASGKTFWSAFGGGLLREVGIDAQGRLWRQDNLKAGTVLTMIADLSAHGAKPEES